MKLKVSRLYEATPVITAIVNENRRLPGKGKYRMARLFAKLAPEYNIVHQRRLEIIQAYDSHPPLLDKDSAEQKDAEDKVILDMNSWIVPPEHMAEFRKQWEEIASEEIDVEIEPVPMDQLCADGSEGAITATEYVHLGELVRE